MKNLYWHPAEVPAAIGDWVNREVIAALSQLIKEGDMYLSFKEGKLKARFYSFEKPEKNGRVTDCWGKEFNLVKLVGNLGKAYSVLPHAMTDEQRKDNEIIAKELDKLGAIFREKVGL